MPVPLAQWLDNTGAVLNAGGLCVFQAGTSTLATTYTTAALSVANANPILFNSAGRPASGGVFLTPGSSYKFVLKDFTGVGVPTCIPDSGVTIWSVDNVEAVPGSASSVDVTATAGESIQAGESVFVSTGDGGLNAGQIYKTDADLLYKSTSAAMVGIAPEAITSGDSGSVRLYGAVTLTGPLTSGAPYYASASAGSLTATAPTNAIRIGQATTATTFLVGYTSAPVGPAAMPCGRLTLTSGLPVTFADVTAATTVYYTPNGCNQLPLFNGSAWTTAAFAEISIAVPASTNTNYDVFAYDNAGVVALETQAWNNSGAGTSVRHAAGTYASVLPMQNGVFVKSTNGTAIDATRIYLGSFRTTGVSGQTADSLATRFLWNYYNRRPRPMRVLEATNSWNYEVDVWRQANGSTANQLAAIIGVIDQRVLIEVQALVKNTTGNVRANVGISQNSTSQLVTGNLPGSVNAVTTSIQTVISTYSGFPTLGYVFWAWLERSAATATQEWYGDNGDSSLYQAGIEGMVMG